MREVETSAKTREEAIAMALQQLGAERHEVDVQIVEQGSGGFLGLGRRNWIVRVRLERDDIEEPREPRPPREQRERGKGGHRAPARHAAPSKPEQPAPKAQGYAKPQPQERTHAPARQQAPVRQPAPTGPGAPSERSNDAAVLLETIVKKMGIEASVAGVGFPDGAIRLNVQSPDSAILIGRKGQGLASLQHLVNLMMQSEDSDTIDRVTIDIEGYIERRNSNLEEMAVELAKKVKETGKRVRVRPLPPEERRIVHLTLEKDEEVRTFSVGNSPVRSIIIAPKNEAPSEDRRPSGDRGKHKSEGQPRQDRPPRPAGSRRGGRDRHRRPGGGGSNEARPA